MVCDDCFETEECRCGPGEMCGVCFESRVKPEDVPRILTLVSEPKKSERLSLTAVCACSHVNNWHVRADHSDTHCAASDCPCGAFRASSEDEEALPPCTCGPDEACGDPCDYESRAQAEEPPLTPEEEEAIAAKFEAADAEHLPPPGGPEYTPCVCGHIEPDHCPAPNDDCAKCDCSAYRTKPDEPPPPQPERRPPYAVSYSVQGHLFEVALSGDATVRAVDGALVIQHHLGPVAGIVSVLPVINKES